MVAGLNSSLMLQQTRVIPLMVQVDRWGRLQLMALELGLGQEPVLCLLQHRNSMTTLHMRCITDVACTAKHACDPF